MPKVLFLLRQQSSTTPGGPRASGQSSQAYSAQRGQLNALGVQQDTCANLPPDTDIPTGPGEGLREEGACLRKKKKPP
jgi:hypothetical protein